MLLPDELYHLNDGDREDDKIKLFTVILLFSFIYLISNGFVVVDGGKISFSIVYFQSSNLKQCLNKCSYRQISCFFQPQNVRKSKKNQTLHYEKCKLQS